MADLDYTNLMPGRPTEIKVGENVYQLDLDVPAVVFARVQRWMRTLEEADEAAAEEEAIELTARVLKIPETEARVFGPMVRRGILGFLAAGSFPARTTTP